MSVVACQHSKGDRMKPLHRRQTPMPEKIMAIPASLHPVFEALAQGIIQFNIALVDQITPYLKSIAELAARIERNQPHPRVKPAWTPSTRRLASVRRRMLAYRKSVLSTA